MLWRSMTKGAASRAAQGSAAKGHAQRSRCVKVTQKRIEPAEGHADHGLQRKELEERKSQCGKTISGQACFYVLKKKKTGGVWKVLRFAHRGLLGQGGETSPRLARPREYRTD